MEEVHGIDGLTRPDIFDSSTLKGNIIDHLRTSVRAEAAQQNQQLYKSFGESAASSSSIQQSSCEDLSDIEDVDSEHSTGCHEGQSINWKNGTIMLPEGGERKLSVEEMEILRLKLVLIFYLTIKTSGSLLYSFFQKRKKSNACQANKGQKKNVHFSNPTNDKFS